MKPIFASKPLQLVILQPTSFCNIQCEYCYLSEKNRDTKGLMSVEVLETICKKVFGCELVNQALGMRFTWHAGEPLVAPISFYKNAIELTTKYKKEHLEVVHQIVTNATLITDEWCKFFVENKIEIVVSIDSPEFIHDAFRKKRNGKGSFKDAIRGITLLKQYGIRFYTLTTITHQTLDYAKELFEFYEEFGIESIGLNFEEIVGHNQSTSLTNGGIDKKVENFIRTFYNYLKVQKKIKVREFETILGYVFYGEEYDSVQSNSISPFSILSIDKDGNFCTFSQELLDMKHNRYGDFVLGNIMIDDIDEVAKSPKLKEIYNEIIQGVENCQNECEYFDVCGGGMPSSKLSGNGNKPEEGRFDATETLYCKLAIKKMADIVLEDLETMSI